MWTSDYLCRPCFMLISVPINEELWLLNALTCGVTLFLWNSYPLNTQSWEDLKLWPSDHGWFATCGFTNSTGILFWLFWWQMSKRWAGAALTSAPIWETHSSQQWMDWLWCVGLSVSLASFFFLCYLWNASLHISLCCRPYHTLLSHLINHAIELNATQQKPERVRGLAFLSLAPHPPNALPIL